VTESPAELRTKAERYRRVASAVTDQQALKALAELAAHYEALATKLERSGPLGDGSAPDAVDEKSPI
jgi:hypothetical protein